MYKHLRNVSKEFQKNISSRTGDMPGNVSKNFQKDILPRRGDIPKIGTIYNSMPFGHAFWEWHTQITCATGIFMLTLNINSPSPGKELPIFQDPNFIPTTFVGKVNLICFSIKNVYRNNIHILYEGISF